MSYMTSQEGKNTSRFYPKNLKKFKSKTEYCICRSGWEIKFCKWCDSNDQILYWSSEPISIQYYNPVKMKEARYFPDFLIKVIDKTSRLEKIWLVEVKPYKECIPPKSKSKKTRLYEARTYSINRAKWIAAQKYCKKKGWKFKIITEKELF